MPKIELAIDELVLHGFPQHDRARIGEAVRAELERQLASHDLTGLAPRTRTTSLDAGSFDVGVAASSNAIGASVARKIVGALPKGRGK